MKDMHELWGQKVILKITHDHKSISSMN
jgi:hypothetical protein